MSDIGSNRMFDNIGSRMFDNIGSRMFDNIGSRIRTKQPRPCFFERRLRLRFRFTSESNHLRFNSIETFPSSSITRDIFRICFS